MTIDFFKYQGAGNDFVLLDNRSGVYNNLSTKNIEQLCDRRFGIGADGLILLENADGYDFRMVYYNSDGRESSMCGNGGRCIVAFAERLKVITAQATFIATDGPHKASISADGSIILQMKDVEKIDVTEEYSFLNTGSPHHIQFVDSIKDVDVKSIGSKIRYSNLYGVEGSNVNFVEQNGADIFSIRTYERGVEDETLACGTGATAVAIAMHNSGKTESTKITIEVEGGTLTVCFDRNGDKYQNIYLGGPAEFVFSGSLNLKKI